MTEPALDIRLLPPQAAADCENILRALPDWFGIEEAIVTYRKDIEEMGTHGAFIDSMLVGFITINGHFEHAAEIHVMGVLAEFHRQGVGRALVNYAQELLRDDGVEYLQVKTLSPSRECEEYERTRRFYLALGFRPLEELPTLWGEANPCLILVKRL